MNTDSIPLSNSIPHRIINIFASARSWAWLGCCYLLLLVSGCASYGVIKNAAMPVEPPAQEYSLKSNGSSADNSEIILFLSFSGGGTRAAATAYGVLQELRDTVVQLKSGPTRLLDEVDILSSVSGGSFTAAYYGLHGYDMFDTFEDVFLRHNIEKQLIIPLFNPLHWFSTRGRTELAVKYYQERIFHGATYADMMKPGRPFVIINSSDLAHGVRFSFVQEYFDLLCSDILSFPVARAVAASSAVPVAFNPIVVENYSNCVNHHPEWLEKIHQRAMIKHNRELSNLAGGLKSYSNKEQRKYIHFVDGGITDNTGLRAVFDIVELSGGPKAYWKKAHLTQATPSRLVLITVDASTSPVYHIDETNKQPSIRQTISAMSGVQLHRYNAATIDLTETYIQRSADELSTPENTVTPYFIEVRFEDFKESSGRLFLNKIPTSFSLTDEEVDKLIEAGRTLLRNHPDFKRLLADIKNS